MLKDKGHSLLHSKSMKRRKKWRKAARIKVKDAAFLDGVEEREEEQKKRTLRTKLSRDKKRHADML
jgi:hypothetical protein